MISREALKGILLEQRQKIEAAKNKNYVLRESIAKAKKFYKTNHSIIIAGARRCGKSVFLSQIIDNFYDKYYYINFEDERLVGFELQDFNTLYELCIELFSTATTFFLDEVQNIDGWEKWVRRMYDNDFKFFITGSNATLLSKELATLLTGRHIQFSLFPFSFREYLKFSNFDLKENDVYITEKRSLLYKHFSEYVKNGGFPEYLKFGEMHGPYGSAQEK